MNLREHDNQSGMKVWLSAGEVEQLLRAAQNTEHRIAFALAARCGLRSHEVLDVAPQHVVSTDAGRMLRVPHGKGDQYRETPMPDSLWTTISTVQDLREDGETVPLVASSSTRTLRRWLAKTTDTLAAEDDDRWRELSYHDLRRTWATNLQNADVDPLLACDWGGWNDLDTFLEHYQGRFSPAAQKREREKVDWL